MKKKMRKMLSLLSLTEKIYNSKPILALLSDLYFKLETISISVSRPSFCSILYYLLTTYTTILKKI